MSRARREPAARVVIEFGSVGILVRLHAAIRQNKTAKAVRGDVPRRSARLVVLEFVPAATIDFIYIGEAYYVVALPAHAKAYTLLRDALARSKRVAIGALIFAGGPRLAALQPVGAALVLSALRFRAEIRSLEDLGFPRLGAGWNLREMDLASHLIDARASDWRPKRYQQPDRRWLTRNGDGVGRPARSSSRPASLARTLAASLRDERAADEGQSGARKLRQFGSYASRQLRGSRAPARGRQA